jgi:NAD(P)-dependent dehydrogenase (short-subunit alcohol dehydrogenase family)
VVKHLTYIGARASESLAREIAPFNIRVVLVEPGAFRTNFALAFAQTTVVASEPYQTGPVADVLSYMANLEGKQKGDLAKGVARLFEVVGETGLGKDLGEYAEVAVGK